MDTSIDTVTELEDGGVLVGVPYQAQIVEKGWGAEHILGPSTGYLFKKLFMKAGCRCSLQLHNFKEETVLVITGQLKVTVRVNEPDFYDTEFILGPGDYFHLSPRTIHRMEALEDCYYVEASTSHGSDVVRLHSDYPEPEDVELVDGDPDFLGMGTFSSVLSELETGKRNWSPPIYCSDFPFAPNEFLESFCNPPDPSPELIEMVSTKVKI